MSWLTDLFEPLLLRFHAEPEAPPPPDVPSIPSGLRVRLTTRQEAVDRALSWVGQPSRYRLGGGADIDQPHPFAEDGTCDCSGFTAHVTGHARIQRIGGKRISYYTDNIVRDCHKYEHGWRIEGSRVGPGPRHLYTYVRGEVRPGDLIVRAGRYSKIGGAWRRTKIGHVGIITGIGDRFDRSKWLEGAWKHLRVAHCTPNRGRVSAVRLTDAKPFRRRAFIVRPRWYLGG